MIQIQVTLFDKNKQYRPMSTLLSIDSMDYYKANKASVQRRAIENIAHQRRMPIEEIKKLGYTLIKVREYDKEKIKQEQELKHKINLIKYYERKRKELKES